MRKFLPLKDLPLNVMNNFKDIKSYFKNLSDKNRLSVADVEQVAFDEAKYDAAINDVRQRLKVKLLTGFCSSVLVNQIARHYCNLGERFANTIEFYHGSTILDTIELLETGKLKGEEFTKSQLIGGLYKEHHSALSQINSIATNISHGINEEIVESAKNRFGDSLFGLLNSIHSETINKRKRKGKLTGEWIVFTKIGSVNYYLCLATHQEGKGEAEIIYNKILPTFDEFSALAHLKK